MAALFRWAACHREGRKRSGRGKNRIILSPRFFCLQTTFRRASRRADTHTHFFWQQVTLGIQWTFWEDLFWDKARDTMFFFGLFFLLFQGGETTAGQAEVGNSAAAAAEREGIPNWMDGRMDDGRMGSMAGRVWCISFSFVQFFCVCFLPKAREREREREGYPVAANSCQLQRRRLHAYNPPPPSPTHTHTLFTRV